MNLIYIYLVYLFIKFVFNRLGNNKSNEYEGKQDPNQLDKSLSKDYGFGYTEEKSKFKNLIDRLGDDSSNKLDSFKDFFDEESSEEEIVFVQTNKIEDEKKEAKEKLILELREMEESNRLTQLQEYEIANALDKVVDSDLSREIVNQLKNINKKVVELEGDSIFKTQESHEENEAEELIQAVIYSEILAKPKSIRRRG